MKEKIIFLLITYSILFIFWMVKHLKAKADLKSALTDLIFLHLSLLGILGILVVKS